MTASPDRPGLGAAPARPRQRLCDRQALAEGGRAWVWDVLAHGRPLRAFALRHGGVVRAYLDRCVHVPVEMDWVEGEFLDAERRFIVCSVHGATYDPADGRCVGGPCGRGSLAPLRVEEAGDGVYWYPSDDIRPLFPDPSAASESPP